jgi:hypothetical protein
MTVSAGERRIRCLQDQSCLNIEFEHVEVETIKQLVASCLSRRIQTTRCMEAQAPPGRQLDAPRRAGRVDSAGWRGRRMPSLRCARGRGCTCCGPRRRGTWGWRWRSAWWRGDLVWTAVCGCTRCRSASLKLCAWRMRDPHAPAIAQCTVYCTVAECGRHQI